MFKSAISTIKNLFTSQQSATYVVHRLESSFPGVRSLVRILFQGFIDFILPNLYYKYVKSIALSTLGWKRRRS